jgi:hypothetical protein
MRYSRFIPFSSRSRDTRAELFRRSQERLQPQERRERHHRVVTTDVNGAPLAPIPDPFPAMAATTAHHQAGFKLIFYGPGGAGGERQRPCRAEEQVNLRRGIGVSFAAGLGPRGR